MKIGQRLIAGYLAVAFLVAAIGYLGIIMTSTAKEGFGMVTNHTIPKIKALEVLKFAGLRIVSSTSEFGFIRAEKEVTGQKIAQTEKEEEQLIEQGIKLYSDTLKEYEDLLNRFSSEGGGFLQEIRKKGLRLQQTSEELVGLKRHGVTGLEVLEKKEVFERNEKAFLAVLDAAILSEKNEFLRKKADLELSLEIYRNLGIAATVISVIAAIVVGTFISRSVSIPIKKLKDAMVDVGRGNLGFRIDIDAKDEIGALATSFNQMTQDLQKSHRHLRALSASLLSAQEQERKRISLELHDDLGQLLTVVLFDIAQLIKPEIVFPSGTKGILERIQAGTEEALQRVRSLSAVLRPGVLDSIGLQAAIESFLEDIQERIDIKIVKDIEMQAGNHNISEFVTIVVYRILQEAMTNIIRHAAAKQVIVKLRSDLKAVALSITDDGQGFNPESLPMDKGIGLLGMKERAECLGGLLKVESAPGQGTTIYIEIPLSPEQLAI